MRTAVRPRGAQRGRHHRAVLVTFRPTWRQTLSAGLRAGCAATGALALVAGAATALPPLAERITGTTLGLPQLPALAWLAVLVPVPLGVLGGLLLGRQLGVRLDGIGVHPLSFAPQSDAAWARVMDIRTERRRRRTVVVLCLRDGSIVRLRAPFDGGLLGRDPQFERKLFMIRHVWETHRQLRNRVGPR
jgi:hypothetical protein